MTDVSPIIGRSAHTRTSVASGLRLRATPACPGPLEIDNGERTSYSVRYNDGRYHRSQLAFSSRRFIMLGVCISATVLAVVAWSFISVALDEWYWNHADTRWTWDHNIYVHTTDDDEAQSVNSNESRNILIVQQATSMNVARILDVTSRVNRAYAKHWGIDYVRLDGAIYAAEVLQRLFRIKAEIASSPHLSRDSKGVKREYDAIVMLDTDAIIVDMDYNIRNLFAPGFLVGTIGGRREGAESTVELNDGAGIVFWNLNHAEIGHVSKLWRDELNALEERGLIVDESSVLANVFSSTYSPRELKSLVQPLSPPQVSFFSGNAVRFMRKPSYAARKTGWLDTDWQDIAIVLEQTADAACFKFYPKCDLL